MTPVELRVIGGDSQYGHRFGFGSAFAVTVYGSGTYELAQRCLPFQRLPWVLLDAGPHYARPMLAASRGMSTPDSSRVSAENHRAPDGDFNRTERSAP